jgi:hypothetical protein
MRYRTISTLQAWGLLSGSVVQTFSVVIVVLFIVNMKSLLKGKVMLYDSIGKLWATPQQLIFHLTITISLKFNLQDRDCPMKKKLLKDGPQSTN